MFSDLGRLADRERPDAVTVPAVVDSEVGG